MRKCKGFLFGILLVMSMVLVACGQDAGDSNTGKASSSDSTGDKLKIGLSVSDLTLERWQR